MTGATTIAAVIASMLAGAVLGTAVMRAQAPDAITGVPYVVDGDSLRIGDTRIRLAYIDAPESAQRCVDASNNAYACGLLATSALEELIAGRSVSCVVVTMDRYYRQVAVCSVAGTDIGDYMVRSGMAVDYTRYDKEGVYAPAQHEAIAARRGIWQGHFEQPEIWRMENPR
jgi:endonuclease YncB( thermonuclease family)